MLQIVDDDRGVVITDGACECVLGHGDEADQVALRAGDILRFNGIHAVEIYLQGVIEGAAVMDRQWRNGRRTS